MYAPCKGDKNRVVAVYFGGADFQAGNLARSPSRFLAGRRRSRRAPPQPNGRVWVCRKPVSFSSMKGQPSCRSTAGALLTPNLSLKCGANPAALRAAGPYTKLLWATCSCGDTCPARAILPNIMDGRCVIRCFLTTREETGLLGPNQIQT